MISAIRHFTAAFLVVAAFLAGLNAPATAQFAQFQAASNAPLVIPTANNVATNWQKSGLAVIGGIPTRNTQCGSTVTPSGLTPPTAGDDFSLITTAINNCTAGQAVLLSGNFVLDQSQTIALNKGITLRGAGVCNLTSSNTAPACPTWITVRNGPLPTYVAGGQCGVIGGSTNSCTASNSIIYMAPNGTFDYGWNSCGHTNPCNSGTPLAVDAAQGASTIQVTSTTGYSVGEWILIDEASGAQWLSDPVSSFGLTWASADFLTSSSSPVNGKIVWGEHNPHSAIDDLDFGTGSYPYNTPGGLSCGYGINCDRPTSEMHLISAIGAGPCPGAACTITFDSPLTIAFRQSGGWQGFGYISSGSGSSSAGSTLTVTSTTSGTLAIQQPLWWSGITGSTAISYITAGSGTSWTTSNAQIGGSGNASISVGTPGSPVAISAAAHNAQIYHVRTQSGGALSVLQQAGVENLSISRGGNGNISTQFCVLCWIKNVDTFAFVNGAVNLNDSARVEIVGSFLHDCYDCENNGVEYALSLNAGTTENLIDNNIITNSGKGMVGRASGGGNVISYNYCDDTFYMASGGIGNFFVDHCLNMSHFKGSHHALFEGNYGNTGGDDNTHGNVVYNVYYRNNLTGLRAPFNDPSLATSTSVTFNAADAPENDQTGVCFATGHAYPYTSCGPLRAASVMLWAYWHAFSGNVLGKSGVTTAGNGWVNNGLYGGTQFGANWILGWNNLLTGTDPNLDGTNTPRWVWQDGNFDYLSGSVTWTAGAHSLPNSLYLSAAPAFFGPGASATYTWPQVTPTGSPQIQTNSLSGSGLPAKARYDAGTPFSQPHHDELTEPANDNDPAQDIARALNAA